MVAADVSVLRAYWRGDAFQFDFLGFGSRGPGGFCLGGGFVFGSLGSLSGLLGFASRSPLLFPRNVLGFPFCFFLGSLGGMSSFPFGVLFRHLFPIL